MIRTPSLRTRVTVVTAGVIVLLVVSLEAFVYLSLRDRLNDGLDEVLVTRAALVTRVAEDATSLAELDAELTQLGVPAVLRGADGTVIRSEPAVRRLTDLLPGGGDGVVRRMVPLPDGGTAEVLASRGGVDATLQRVLLVEIVGTSAALVVAALLLVRASSVITRPLDRMVDTALEIAGGDRDRRLRPSDPTTELGRLAAAFDETIDALDAALTEAEDAEHRSRRFLADAAHQLRTPLAGLRASAETLLANPDGPDRLQLTGNVSREATRLTRLVDRLLRIARIDRGERPTLRTVDLGDLVRREVGRQQPLAPSLDFDLTVPAAPLLAPCDPEAVRDAVANLLDNARRHADTRVVVTLDQDDGRARLRVTDDGPGVPADLRAEVFERFMTTTGDGSGLGLPIARGIVEAHDGTLDLVDDAFVIRLPVDPGA